jgi:hypothetical protein
VAHAEGLELGEELLLALGIHLVDAGAAVCRHDLQVLGLDLTMPKYKLEYIWLDGYTPLAGLRSKTQIKEFASLPKLADLPIWGFDGSSTQQAEGKSSDCKLKARGLYPTRPARTACW